MSDIFASQHKFHRLDLQNHSDYYTHTHTIQCRSVRRNSSIHTFLMFLGIILVMSMNSSNLLVSISDTEWVYSKVMVKQSR